MKKNVAVVFGGCTVEHDVSIVTGLQFIENMDKEKYDVTPIYISNNGEWYTGEELLDMKTYKEFDKAEKKLTKVLIPPIPSIKAVMSYPSKFELFARKVLKNIDVVIPAMHGMNGEDGTIQGLFELANIPYVGSGVVGSSVGMDKAVMKAVFKGLGLPILNYSCFLRADWEKDQKAIISKLEAELEYPMFVKPANLGSSIGISKAKDREGLIKAVEIAVYYDRKIIVEQGVENPLEVNCAVLGYGSDIMPSVCEEPVSWEDFLTFEDKYMRAGKGKTDSGGMSNMDRKIPADIPEELSKKIQEFSLTAFRGLENRGVARIDYIIDRKTMEPYINEINTIPGSFSFYLWEPTGLSYPQLIDKLIDIAFKVNEEKNKNNYSYDSKILEKNQKGQKGGAKG